MTDLPGILSYGGGVQSTALLAMAINGEMDAAAAVHANVGDDSEHPDAVAYLRDVAVPRCEAAGFPLAVVANDRGTLRSMLVDDPKFQGVPVRMNGSGAPGRRTCTAQWKVRPIDAWKKANGYADHPTILGISLDEFHVKPWHAPTS